MASITSFGAFIAVDADTDGLCHISQIADEHVTNVEDYLEVGQSVQVRIIEVDVDNCRLGLSMREPRAPAPRGGGRGAKKDVSFLLGRDPEEFIPGRVRVEQSGLVPCLRRSFCFDDDRSVCCEELSPAVNLWVVERCCRAELSTFCFAAWKLMMPRTSTCRSKGNFADLGVLE